MTRTFLYQPKEETTVGSFMAADSHFSLFTHTWHHSFIKYSLNLSSSRVFVFISCCCWMNCHKLSGLPTQLRGKESACNAEDLGSIPRLGRSPGGGHGNPLAWRIPWTEEPGRVLSMGSQRVRHNWSDLACMHTKAVSPIPLKWSHTILCKTLCETPSVRLGKAFSLIELYFN